MQLTADQIKAIETLAGSHFSPIQIALIMNVDKDEFISLFDIDENDPDYTQGHPRYHYDRGMLLARADIDKGTLKRARDGNQISIQQFKKDVWQQRIETEKNKVFARSRKKMLTRIDRSADSAESMLSLIKADYEQIEFIRDLFVSFSSKSKIIDRIRQRWPAIRPYEAERLFNEVVNFYYITNNEVKVEAWRNIYAERLDELFLISFNLNDWETARRCLVSAAELRGVNKEEPEKTPTELLDRRPILYTIKISDLGLPETNRYELANLIDNLDISEKEKQRLRRDAQVPTDVEFELFEDAKE